MTRCCIRTPNDGVLDRERIERAVQGLPGEVTKAELTAAILLKRRRHNTGLNELAAHFGYARSSVAEILARHRA